MTENPFNIDFGGKPSLFIPRYNETSKIITTFTAQNPSTHIFMIVGARGNGKTVFMGHVTEKLLEGGNWLHVDLSPESDMMSTLASGIWQKSRKKKIKLTIKAGINVGYASVGITTESGQKYSSVYTDIDEMLDQLKKQKIRLLITVDEAVNSKSVRELTVCFQHCLREGYQVFLLMTGLYKNIRALQNNRTQTFLKRAPKIVMESLNKNRIAEKYREVFDISDEKALEMADYTNGYSYAFQILGYLLFESKKKNITSELLKEYRLYIGESSYDKIWEELSEKERTVAKAAADEDDDVTVKTLREKLNMNSNEFSTYKDTLEKSGIFSSGAAYGRVRFALPFIREYIRTQPQ